MLLPSYPQRPKSVGNVKHSYQYPRGNVLKPGTEKHDRLVDYVLQRGKYSYDAMSKRHQDWRKIDQNLTGFVPLDVAEARIKAQDYRKPVRLIIPMSFYTQDTFMTYYASEFLKLPFFEYAAQDPGDRFKAYLLEELVRFDSMYSNLVKKGFIFFKDITRYGFGAMSIRWKKREKQVRGDFKLVYDGNEYDNVDPYLFLPDPDAPLDAPNESLYTGYVELTNYNQLLMEEDQDFTGEMFNARYLEQMDGQSNIVAKNYSGRSDKYGHIARSKSTHKPVDIVHMWCLLSPKEYNIGRNDTPEWWLISVAADSVVVSCQPMDQTEYDIPLVVGAPDTDGYSSFPISRVETDFGMQEAVDYLMSSHIANVRKAVNDMFIVDPNKINMRDLVDPRPGKLIRMKSDAWGGDIKSAIHQFPVNDVTRGNLNDINNLLDLNNRFIGPSDSISGHWRKGSERVSATEAQGTMQSALSRLERMATLVQYQAMLPLAQMTAYNVQNFMTQDKWVKITAEWQRMIYEIYKEPSVLVRREDIDIEYDVVPRGGGAKNTYTQDPQAWVQALQVAASNPQLAQEYDMTKIYGELLKSLGITSIGDLKSAQISANVAPDGAVQAAAQAGNVVPINQLPQQAGGGI